ncbi:universal stress protein [Arthrobacter sp. zg-Y769]|uniref:universal stress protein n=1 Tax=Arthrobacter sp. zg-Y769 TaxID=2894191 RepID=UPI001E44C45F|nr:universal stress protein [Arthrobacter sp. zg-Y769]MCC9205552.1 universal stress protein [Arthrobacter sp. zg-Y769]
MTDSTWGTGAGADGPAGIVVGVDGSDQSICALFWAAREARRRQCPLHVVTAYTVPIFAASSMDAGYTTVDDAIIRDGARQVLDEAVERIGHYGIEVIPRVETGDAAAVLLELSEDADLMVVGSRGRGGFVGRLLGSVSSALPAHAKCPTVVVPLRTAGRLPDSGVRPPANSPDPDAVHRAVVVGVDGSEQGRAASLVAAEQAQSMGLPLRILCALPPFTGSLAWVPAPLDIEALHAELHEQLDAGRDWLQSHFPGLEMTVELVDGAPGEILIERTAKVELLVMGTRGRGGFAGMLLGSTSQSVMHHAKGPLMVVPDRDDPRLLDRPNFGPMVAE